MSRWVLLYLATVTCLRSVCFLFFSSRRRHTRYIGDWSSDVCSSDLEQRDAGRPELFSRHGELRRLSRVYAGATVPDRFEPGDCRAIHGYGIQQAVDRPARPQLRPRELLLADGAATRERGDDSQCGVGGKRRTAHDGKPVPEHDRADHQGTGRGTGAGDRGQYGDDTHGIAGVDGGAGLEQLLRGGGDRVAVWSAGEEQSGAVRGII